VALFPGVHCLVVHQEELGSALSLTAAWIAVKRFAHPRLLAADDGEFAFLALFDGGNSARRIYGFSKLERVRHNGETTDRG
jgi:hypothetical protein